MIKYYYKSLRSLELKDLTDYQRGSWIYVEAPSEEEIDLLEHKFKLDRGFLEDALDTDEMPRLEREEEVSYIFVRFAYRNPEGDLITAPLLFVFGQDILLTISPVHLPALDRFLQGKVEGFATTQRAKLVLQILNQISDYYDSYIGTTSKQIKAIRARLRGHEITNQDFIDFVTIEDELNEFLASLLPTNATLRRLLLGRYMPLFEEDQDIVEDLLLNNEQSIEACNSNMKSIANIREAYSSISSNNLNRTIKILTLLTAITGILNIFFAYYGMNVELPFQHRDFAVEFVTALSALAVISILYYGRKKRLF